MQVSLEGKILKGKEYKYNATGFQTHGAIYAARADINAIFHLHTPYMVAVSAIEKGLIPISQWALHFYKKIAYHNYDSLVLNSSQGNRLVKDISGKNIMLLRNHGSILCGKTIHEAMFYTHHLELACKCQCLTLAMGEKLSTPNEKTCTQAVKDLLSFEKDLGKRDWVAWLSLLEKSKSNITH